MDIKSFLHSWCAKKGLTPSFDFRATGPKHRQRFLCEVRVEGIAYAGAGNSTTKKEAQGNASKDFVSYLVRSGQVAASEVPEEAKNAIKIEEPGIQNQGNGDQQQHNQQQQRPVFQEGMDPQSMGPAYQAYGGENRNFTYMDRMQQQKNVEEAEDLDVNASLHGNWTMENAKSKLHQFLQVNKINTDYSYKAVGPDHTRYKFEMDCRLQAQVKLVSGCEERSDVDDVTACDLQLQSADQLGLVPITIWNCGQV